MASRFTQSTVVTVSNYHDGSTATAFPLSASTAADLNNDSDFTSVPHHRDSEFIAESSSNTTATTMAYLPQTSFFNGLHHDAFELELPTGPSDSDLVSKWRPKDKVCCYIAFNFMLLFLIQLFKESCSVFFFTAFFM
jgi:regulator-associated protein of mTOR